MTQRRSKSGFQLRTPMARVDLQHAWRQNEDAVILPIVYELAEPDSRRLQPDSDIVAINWPLKLPSRRHHNTSIISLDVLSGEEDRKKKLALLKDKVESARARVLGRGKFQDKDESSTTNNQSNPPQNLSAATGAKPNSSGKSPYFSTAVQLLLLSVIALVVFAWICFR
ncbi:MAG: hypothetical protein SF097_02595 [Acidobacteriota bacterium]|nr:hypothetical protein [Acidobacteriota bacterium]